MEIQNLIKSTSYIEFICKIDNLVNELLYSQDEGYVNLTSKNAIKSALKIIEKFNADSEKITKEYSISDIDEILNQKRNELISQIRKHYHKELYTWVSETFNTVINNLLLKISINSDNKELVNNCQNNINEAVVWLCNALNYNSEQEKNILVEIDKKIVNALNSKDKDYLNINNPKKSKYDVFLKMFDLITSNSDKFCEINFDNYKHELSSKDMQNFKQIQIKLAQNKTDITDKINIINYAINKLQLKNDEKKYDFIVQIADIFKNTKDNSWEKFKETVKTRYEIFNNKEEYYRKLFGF